MMYSEIVWKDSTHDFLMARPKLRLSQNAFWKHFECENSFCKKSRNLSWVGAGFSFKWLNFSKMHEILRCLKFEAVVDVIWKSFLVCLITWMLNFFQIKYFDVDTHGAFDSGSVYLISECQGLLEGHKGRFSSKGNNFNRKLPESEGHFWNFPSPRPQLG